MIRTGLYTFGFLRMTLAACVGIPLIIASSSFAQNLEPLQTLTGAAPAPPTAEAERVIVTGSNIPTAEEVGPNPVDTYNRDSINKSGELTTEQFLLSLPVVNANVVPRTRTAPTPLWARRQLRSTVSMPGPLSSFSMDAESLRIRRATTPAWLT